MRVVLAAALMSVCRFAGATGPTLEPKPNETDGPGSGVTPPKTIEAPLPQPSPKRQDGIKLGVWIKEDGSVDAVEVLGDSKQWSETVVATVKKWRFEPVMWKGKALPARTEIEFVQDSPKMIRSLMSPLPNLPVEVHTEEEFGVTKPLIETDPDLILPLIVRANGQRIDAAMSYVIQEDGSTDKIEILAASSEGAVRSALDLIAERKYQPAKVREQPVMLKYRQILGFRSLDPRIEALNGGMEIVDPIYPYERMLAQDEGNATVRITLTEKGAVKTVELVEASHSDFGNALIAAADSWTFNAETAAEQNVREYRHEFMLANTPYAARRLIAGVREGKTISNTAAGLDAKPKLQACPSLVYPTALLSEKISGSAKVEFVIDRVGLAQLPRVIEATRPEFGWSAVTLVNGMRFKPVTRGGKPAELRVIMPIMFEPPKTAEPAAAAAPPVAP